MDSTKVNKLCLVVIDGWGHSESKPGNAILNSKNKIMKKLSQTDHSYLIHAHGKHVGLPPNQMGNSEVGHITIGAGRVILQDILRIRQEIDNNNFGKILDKTGLSVVTKIHLIGLVSDGGIHSHIDILKNLLLTLKSRAEICFLHFISDGRDTSPRSFEKYFEEITKFMNEISFGSVASVGGRYYGMDRNNNHDRIELAFQSMAHYSSFGNLNLEGVTSDEMIKPVLINIAGIIEPDDSVLFFNFRADRMRSLVRRFIGRNIIYTLTEYDKSFTPEKNVKVLFPPVKIKNTLSEIIANANLSQAHIAETEKYAHVTYFFDGGNEETYPKETRILVDSPEVEDYSKTPGMNMVGVCDEVKNAMEQKINFIVCNLAAPDMIGHTGNYEATLEAVALTDKAVSMIYEKSIEFGYTLIITADHGNCEMMFENDGKIKTSHTSNPVPFILVEKIGTKEEWGYKNSDYSLQDVAPTILHLMKLPQPEEMTGKSMLNSKK